MRGRPKSTTPVLSSAERQRAYRERVKSQLSLVTENSGFNAGEYLDSIGQPEWSPALNRYVVATMLSDLALSSCSSVPLYGEPDVSMLVVTFIMQGLQNRGVQ